MKRLLTTLTTIMAFGILAVATPGIALGGTAKVDVCHIPPGNPENAHTITISENALKAHLAHGDTVGPCDVAKFSATFPPADQSVAWDAFEAQISATRVYNQIEFFSDTDPGYTCTGPEANTICQTIRAQTNETCTFVPPVPVTCEGNVWSVGECGGTELSVNTPGCTCFNPGTSIRAEIDAACGGNPNVWGAVNGATCSSTPTTMTVICR